MLRKPPTLSDLCKRERDTPPKSRGQMFIATAVTLAATLILLIAVLNAGLYTGTAATLNQDIEQQEAQGFAHAVSSDTQQLFTQFSGDIKANDGLSEAEQEELEAAFKLELSQIEREYQRLYREDNADVEIKIDSQGAFEPKVAAAQTEDGNFTYGGGKNLIIQAEEPEQYFVEFEPDSLSSTEPFTIVITPHGGGSKAEFTFYQDGDEAVVEDDDGNICRFPTDGDRVSGDLVEGEMSGCTEIQWPYEEGEIDSINNIKYENADNIEGQFAIITSDADRGRSFQIDTGDSDKIEAIPTFGSIEITVIYRTPTLTFNQQITVTPDKAVYLD